MPERLEYTSALSKKDVRTEQLLVDVLQFVEPDDARRKLFARFVIEPEKGT